jgi:uncharacterized protein (TIGR03032 family)
VRRSRAGSGPAALDALWAHHHADLRDPHQVVSQWAAASEIDPRLLRHQVRGRFWDALEAAGGTLIVTREYEHLVVALSAAQGRRRVSYLRLPHPSGLAVDAARGRLFVASTRNPNMVFELAPGRGLLARDGASAASVPRDALLPVACRYLPGCLYLHDLALIGGKLHGNAVALNAVVALEDDGRFRPVWWPRSIDGPRGPRLERNYLQLNSIAAGADLRGSFFSASTAEPSSRRPGHLNFPVDGRGVVFSGRTRQVIATGLTRPHSARLAGGTLWVANSGYGEIGRVAGGRFERLAALPGWTRGLCFHQGVAFVGTSRVIPRFRHYAPGVDPRSSETGVHAVEAATGRVLGSLVWPLGNQIFAIELTKGVRTAGFPFTAGRNARRGVERFFFAAMARDPGPGVRRR